MINKELLQELQNRLDMTSTDYEALLIKYHECVARLRAYQYYQYWTKAELDAYIELAGWSVGAMSPTVRDGLRGVVEAYLHFRGVPHLK